MSWNDARSIVNCTIPKKDSSGRPMKDPQKQRINELEKQLAEEKMEVLSNVNTRTNLEQNLEQLLGCSRFCSKFVNQKIAPTSHPRYTSLGQ